MAKETSFKRWRRQVGYTQEQAAEALGLSRSMIINLDAGINRTNREPAVPTLAIRYVMRVIADGLDIEPWPGK